MREGKGFGRLIRERVGPWVVGLTVLALFLGAWILLAKHLIPFGPWAIAAVCLLFVVQVVLLWSAPEWGAALFVAVAAAAFLWDPLTTGRWWYAIFLGLPLLGFALSSFASRRSRRKAPGIEVGSRTDELPTVRLDSKSVDLSEIAKILWPRTALGTEHLLEALSREELPHAEEHPEAEPGQHRPGASRPIDCTVFAPDQVQPADAGLLQVFLHAPEDRARAGADAKTFDRRTRERGHRSLLLDAPIGTLFTIETRVDGFVLGGPENLLWTGRPQAASFPFQVPKRCRTGNHEGTVFVFKDNLPIGKINFIIAVAQKISTASRNRPVGTLAKRYSYCFCSYSSEDRVEMLKREQGIRAAGVPTFVDAVSLRSGDDWKEKISEAIDACDLFVVIWSTNALESKWVRRETRRALRRSRDVGGPDLHPIPIEGPPIPHVPRGLRSIHFNDNRLSFLRAAELERADLQHLQVRGDLAEK